MKFAMTLTFVCVLSFIATGKVEAIDKATPRVVKVLATAYCPCSKCCGWGARGITSAGNDARKPGVAADVRRFPYGTRLAIPGVGVRVVDDTGKALRKDAKNGVARIDVRFSKHKDAVKFGRKLVLVKVLPTPKDDTVLRKK